MNENEFRIQSERLLREQINSKFLGFGCEIIALASLDIVCALDIFRNIFAQQAENGRLSHPDIEGMTVPPVFGFVLLEIGERMKNEEEQLAFFREMYPKVHALHQYLYTHRDPEEEGLIAINHPAESGQANAPTFDAAKKQESFSVQEPFFNALLCLSNEAMIEVGRIIETDVTDFVLWNELTVFSMNDKLWDEAQGIYNAYDLTAKKVILGETLAGLLPIIADVPTLEQAENILQNIKDEFFSGTDVAPMYLCPTYDVTAVDVDFKNAERGAIQPALNWLLYQALQRFDMGLVASQVLSDTMELIEKYGLQSHFDPRKNEEQPSQKNKSATTAAVYLEFLAEINKI